MSYGSGPCTKCGEYYDAGPSAMSPLIPFVHQENIKNPDLYCRKCHKEFIEILRSILHFNNEIKSTRIILKPFDEQDRIMKPYIDSLQGSFFHPGTKNICRCVDWSLHMCDSSIAAHRTKICDKCRGEVLICNTPFNRCDDEK